LNGILENLLFANNDNLFGENKHNFCEGNERGALLVTGNDSNLVVNANVKVGKIHNTEVWVNTCFECLNN
jgi:hypothetical protein